MKRGKRFLRNLGLAARRQWWVAIGERQRIIDERDRFKAWGEQQFQRARESDLAVYMLKVEHAPASIDTLRLIADEIDCGSDCEVVSPMDWSTGCRECPLTDRGECASDKASELRDLATALETYTARTALATPVVGVGHTTTPAGTTS